jgi:hypothetical protein
MAIKVVAGAAGALLVVVLYFTIPRHSPTEPNLQDGKSGDNNTQLTTETPIDLNPDKGKRSTVTTGKDRRVVTEKKDSSQTGTEQEQKAAVPPVIPPVASTPPSDATEAPAPTADISSLSAQMVSVVRGDEDLRVIVRFKNSSDLPLSVTLDGENSVLVDDKGRYGIQGSDLPGSNPRLTLKPGESSQNTFNFQAPQLGGKQFHLTLFTLDGRSIKVSGLP